MPGSNRRPHDYESGALPAVLIQPVGPPRRMGGTALGREKREGRIPAPGTPVVRAAGFEPAASWSRTTRDAELRHARGDGPDVGQCHPVRPVPADAASHGGGCRAYGRFPWRLRMAHVCRLSARRALRIRRRFRALSGGTGPAVVPAGPAYVMAPFFGVWQAICRAPPAGAAIRGMPRLRNCCKTTVPDGGDEGSRTPVRNRFATVFYMVRMPYSSLRLGTCLSMARGPVRFSGARSRRLRTSVPFLMFSGVLVYGKADAAPAFL